MQHYSMYIANQRIEALIAEASRARVAKAVEPSLRQRISHMLSHLRGAIVAPSVSYSR